MKTSVARVEVQNDRDGTIYAFTDDGPYILGHLGEAKMENISDNSLVTVQYDPQDQYCSLVPGAPVVDRIEVLVTAIMAKLVNNLSRPAEEIQNEIRTAIIDWDSEWNYED